MAAAAILKITKIAIAVLITYYVGLVKGRVFVAGRGHIYGGELHEEECPRVKVA